MDRLPEEILLHIFGFLDSTPPSELKARQEPTLHLTSSPEAPLKRACCVSKLWRRVGLPLLFSCTRLQLECDVPPGATGSCWVCGLPANEEGLESEDVEKLHRELAKTACGPLVKCEDPIVEYQVPYRLITYKELHKTISPEQMMAICALMFYHQLLDMLAFLERANLAKEVQSFVLLRGKMPSEQMDRLFTQLKSGWRHLGAAMFWRQLFSVMDPNRVAIVAPPRDLGFWTKTVVSALHEWAFPDMHFHSLELRRDTARISSVASQLPQDNSAGSSRAVFPADIAKGILTIKPWTHLALNEGSFLKAYGTYEYFERGPPTLIYSITDLFAHHAVVLGSVRSFTYTGIFPFANHARFTRILPHVEELDCRFAPDPDSGILDDKDRVGKAELQDCWQELFTAHHELCSLLQTGRLEYPRLKKFVCGDARITGIQAELEHLFTPLCLPEWAEMEPGVFHRLISPPSLSPEQ
ncbi:uncharacterized protein LTR77_004790 [Saxophila tyrrhenica]|uniref:F-box domain-containing protein n=1 Tax=Saxophila tyrrhenica TaxID=1690608 RepID=A0AAV9PA15_9PEZI|nr:hypothetical protein LTR77_004790 [Saxophila tyrrhenica]